MQSQDNLWYRLQRVGELSQGQTHTFTAGVESHCRITTRERRRSLQDIQTLLEDWYRQISQRRNRIEEVIDLRWVPMQTILQVSTHKIGRQRIRFHRVERGLE